MKRYYYGLDVLRGLGIFAVITLHTAFYFYHDLYSVDLNNPTPIITLIGFLLMFAGLFAMISGLVYTLQYTLHPDAKTRIKAMVVSAISLLVIAYFYFIFTGPGIVHFETQTMDESLLVGLINQGRFSGVSFQRLFYVDSLVMLAINIALLAGVFKLFGNYFKSTQKPTILLGLATLFLVISALRIPLYSHYQNALEENQWGTFLLLNWFVAKNNPILPFFAFALYGAYIALLLRLFPFKGIRNRLVPLSISFILLGTLGYILAPETMLEREIDLTWYFIMVIQIGLFFAIILSFIWFFDIRFTKFKAKFFARFGIAGLTPFVLESLVSALIFAFITLFIPLELGIVGALIYGLSLAFVWGGFLMLWELGAYRFGIEWFHSHFVKKFGGSTKRAKLAGDIDDSSDT